jgi:hypothetical protein
MFLRITRTTGPAGLDADAVREIIADAAETLKQQPGFQRFVSGADEQAGTGAIVTLWETREDASFDRSILGSVPQRVADLGMTMAAPEVYEVSVEV